MNLSKFLPSMFVEPKGSRCTLGNSQHCVGVRLVKEAGTLDIVRNLRQASSYNRVCKQLSLVELAEELAHVGDHLFMHLHTRKVPTMLTFCQTVSLGPGFQTQQHSPLKNFRFVVVVSAPAFGTGNASNGNVLTPSGTLIRFSSFALNSVYTSCRTLL